MSADPYGITITKIGDTRITKEMSDDEMKDRAMKILIKNLSGVLLDDGECCFSIGDNQIYIGWEYDKKYYVVNIFPSSLSTVGIVGTVREE